MGPALTPAPAHSLTTSRALWAATYSLGKCSRPKARLNRKPFMGVMLYDTGRYSVVPSGQILDIACP